MFRNGILFFNRFNCESGLLRIPSVGRFCYHIGSLRLVASVITFLVYVKGFLLSKVHDSFIDLLLSVVSFLIQFRNG